jgi:hypothetical protein
MGLYEYQHPILIDIGIYLLGGPRITVVSQ